MGMGMPSFLSWSLAFMGVALRADAGPPHAGLAALPPLLEFANGTQVNGPIPMGWRRMQIANTDREHANITCAGH